MDKSTCHSVHYAAGLPDSDQEMQRVKFVTERAIRDLRAPSRSKERFRDSEFESAVEIGLKKKCGQAKCQVEHTIMNENVMVISFTRVSDLGKQLHSEDCMWILQHGRTLNSR